MTLTLGQTDNMSQIKAENLVVRYPQMTDTSSAYQYETYSLLSAPATSTDTSSTQSGTDSTVSTTDGSTADAGTDTTVDWTDTDTDSNDGITTKDLIIYIALGVVCLAICIIVMMQLFLKDGLPCFRCCKV